MDDRIVIHYDEIALKGKNRSYFEGALAETRAELSEIERWESGIEDADKVVEEAVAQAEIKRFGQGKHG